MRALKSGNLGYPRIGANREWKRALEAFWSDKIGENELHGRLTDIRLEHLRKQRDKGIDYIPVGDFSYYDHVLDTAAMFGIVPSRFAYEGGPVPLRTYFAMARGDQGAAACEMTKWFNTNYHYIVPELKDAKPALTDNRPLRAYREAKERLGIEGRPVIVGLYTFLKLSKGYEPSELDAWVERLLPLYRQVLAELEQEGVRWVQIDEPILVTDVTEADMRRVRAIYEALKASAPKLNLLLQTYFEAVARYEDVVSLPVDGIGLDFVQGREGNLEALERFGFPAGKTLAAGIVDGRNIWASDPDEKISLVERLAGYVSPDRLILQPSCSLLHVPVTTAGETALDPVLLGGLAFADEKLDEVVLVAKAAGGHRASVAQALEAKRAAVQALRASPERCRPAVREAVARLEGRRSARASAFAVRRAAQQARWRLPLLPTTTIGSFPQTPEVRQARQKWRKGEWDDSRYTAFIREQIRTWIDLQEQIGLDVLVHGEFERTDMVEFFGEKLAGFAFTQNGWVQSYGSRCVKPPVLYGDVQFGGPMTVAETVYAQSLTSRPVKGMLTGPVTILNWSFVRDDIPREQVAYQIALALREEVLALEAAGIGMIQVDEPALREGLPLRAADRPDYLRWAVESFRAATSAVRDETQIHTHMCYCEFHDMIDAIRELDADVISIETSRSHGELIGAFEEHTYDLGIGLGVYDIHSPRVPSVEEMAGMIDRALRVLDPTLFWINPDCGLKTRKPEETIAALRHMVQAAQEARARYADAARA
ncbi:5-methyltetrahydropteroyltriglutamate--homocysteine S-methyltransferase [Paenibacillus thermoaerophilus]|uniref:5-methyltetrahydropteroyltriglutamate--homocysteine methyltransferase n=1 Tax=Paenibacillus thermoaerophilus TaxID=1215385 RepID=A0ABW2V326_9BACL|nr:5-methyltetrahydropteroyltriglutamate--homocysteine S-methyltransferase [Paenibacillus thermoaerophilus]TMV11092.1 5-methyltetrahydropteroyltriglutamate--homocysteine S-methyltransferase [Paenibacillus thermoaerophilus]